MDNGNVKRFNYRPKVPRNAGDGRGNFPFEKRNDNRIQNTATRLRLNMGNGESSVDGLPSKRIKVSNCDYDHTNRKPIDKGQNCLDFDLEDDDFESGLTVEDLDQIEIEASQALSKSANSKVKKEEASNEVLDALLNVPSTDNNVGNVTNEFRMPTSTVSFADSSKSKLSSCQSHTENKTIDLFPTTSCTSDGMSLYPQSAFSKTEELESKLASYVKLVEEYKNTQFQRDGEIRILREKLSKAEDELRLERQSRKAVEEQRREKESEREKDLQKEIESLQTQLLFKDKEVNEIRLKAQYDKTPKCKKAQIPASGVPFELDDALLSQFKGKDKSVAHRDVSQQTDSSSHSMPVSYIERAKPGLVSFPFYDYDFHINCPFCKCNEKQEEKLHNLLSFSSETQIENPDNLFLYFTHTLICVGVQTGDQCSMFLQMAIPLVFEIKTYMLSLGVDVQWLSSLDDYHKGPYWEKLYTKFVMDRSNKQRSKINSEQLVYSWQSISKESVDFETFSLLSSKILLLVLRHNQELQELCAWAMAEIGQAHDGGSRQVDDCNLEEKYFLGKEIFQSLLSDNKFILNAFVWALLAGTKYCKTFHSSSSEVGVKCVVENEKIHVLLVDMLAVLATCHLPQSVRKRFLKALIKNDIMGLIMSKEDKQYFVHGMEVLRSMSGSDEVKLLLCSEKENCPLISICKTIVRQPDWLTIADWVDVKLKVVQLLSTVFATNSTSLRQLLESDCDCSQELVKSIVLMLLPELKIQRTKIDRQKDFDLETDVHFSLLCQGTSLLATVCLNDRLLVDHRVEIERQYSQLLHGAATLFGAFLPITEHEVATIQDLIDFDQFDEEEVESTGMKDIECMVVD